jgi:hypothetical protein
MKDAIGHAVNHCAFEAELSDGTLQLVGGRLRVRCRQHGESRETIGMALHRFV